MVTIGIIGCGTIGTALAKKLANRKEFPHVKIGFLSDSNEKEARKLHVMLRRRKAGAKCRVVPIKVLVERADFIIEAASSSISYEVASAALKNNKNVLVMSVGGLLQRYNTLLKYARKTRAHLYLPSGALCGIDGVLAAKGSTITKAVLTTRKPVKGLRGAPYLAKKGIDISRIRKETVIFKGSAREATRYFPKNINVAAVLSLAGIGARKTIVEIVTSPHYKRNSHEVTIEGSFGTLQTRTENVPSPSNPKTSYMAILSAEALLKKIFSPVKIGT